MSAGDLAGGPSGAESWDEDVALRPLRAMALIGAALLFVIHAGNLVHDLTHPPLWWSIVTALILLAVLTAALTLGSPPRRAIALLWRIVPMSGVALLVAWSAVAPDDRVPWLYTLFPALVGFAAVSLPWRGAMVFTAAGALLPPLAATLTDATVSPVLTEHAALQLTNIAFVAIFEGVRHQLTTTARTASAAVAQSSRLAQVRAELDERERVEAIIHDDVLSALLAIADAPNAPTTRRQAERALEALTVDGAPSLPRGAAPVDLAPLLTAAARTLHPVAVVHVPDVPVLVPGEVAEAAIGAVREALRNTARHAGADADPRVTLEDGPTHGAARRVVVRVADEGRGFVVDAIDPRRLGISRTILGRPRAIPGCAARVESTPGCGTLVEVVWEPTP